VRNIAEALQHPQTRVREMVVAIGADYRGIGTPIKLSRTPGAARSAPPRFGEHTREVLRELGCSDAEIDSLISSAIVAVPAAQGEPGLD
jgi:crotonobetainyl-CoA:carnitine CoA-transferase CaiB-like acyl-CoA transferase